MPTRIQWLLMATCLILFAFGPALGQEPVEKGKESPKTNEPADAALITKLINQLGSAKYPEREAATKQLEAIGEPALDPLRKAAKSSKDVETRRRVEQLADRIDLTALEKLVKDGVQQHQNKDYRNAAESFDRALKQGKERFLPKDGRAPLAARGKSRFGPCFYFAWR
jgi:hypothetical protein